VFEWNSNDGQNVDHLALQGVTPEEAEEVFDDPRRRGMPAYQVDNERRFRVLGATEAGRILLMVLSDAANSSVFSPPATQKPTSVACTARSSDPMPTTTTRSRSRPASTHAVQHDPAAKPLIPVNSEDEVPSFANECEEAEFWATHRLGPALLDRMQPIAVEGDDVFPPIRERDRTRPVALRLGEDTLRRLRAVARKKHIGYQTLLKQFVDERLYEEEKREGLI
jgi:uncharacterized DUF497 family protein